METRRLKPPRREYPHILMLSYGRRHILRFGQYALDMADLPPPLDPQPLPFETA